MAGQIIGALKIGYLQLSVVGLRSLFELSVNSVYIFNHPDIGQNKRHMRKFCKEITRLSNKKRNVVHTRICNTSFKTRLDAIGMGRLYSRHYRIMSDWTHLMTRTLTLTTDQKFGQKFGIQIAGNCLFALHNMYDSICAYCKYELDPELEKSVIKFGSSIQSKKS